MPRSAASAQQLVGRQDVDGERLLRELLAERHVLVRRHVEDRRPAGRRPGRAASGHGRGCRRGRGSRWASVSAARGSGRPGGGASRRGRDRGGPAASGGPARGRAASRPAAPRPSRRPRSPARARPPARASPPTSRAAAPGGRAAWAGRAGSDRASSAADRRAPAGRARGPRASSRRGCCPAPASRSPGTLACRASFAQQPIEVEVALAVRQPLAEQAGGVGDVADVDQSSRPGRRRTRRWCRRPAPRRRTAAAARDPGPAPPPRTPRRTFR